MPWYKIYNNDIAFEKYYKEKPHREKKHKKDFEELYWDKYLEIANSFHPDDYNEWKQSLGKLYGYEKALYAKVDSYQKLIIVSFYDLGIVKTLYDYDKELYYKTDEGRLFQRFIYDTFNLQMYHYRMKQFKQIANVLNTCDGKYQCGGWTDYDKFYSQKQRKLDKKSIEILKSLDQFKYLPIEKFSRINVYNLFQIGDDVIYQYEILLKNGLAKLASDLLLKREFIAPKNFKIFKKEIMGGIRLKELNQLIYTHENKEQERIRKLKNKEKAEKFIKMPKLRYDLGEFILRHPRDVKELEQEGRELHHCVANYLDRIVAKETDVMFLRKKSEPDKPFFTVELKNNIIVQCRTFKNKTDPEITNLVEGYFKGGEEWK